MFPTPIEKTSSGAQIAYKIALPVALIVWLLPLIAVALTSVRSAGDITAGNYWGWPTSFNLIENYTAIFEQTPIGKYILNSFKVTIPTVIGAVAISCMTGFALAVYKFKGNLLLFFMFVAGNFVPFQILMVPVRDLTLDLGMYNTWYGLALFHIAFQAGFCTLFMRNFIKALPYELIEAARVEGISEIRIFWYVVMPLMKPALAALSVLIFTFIWNDYFWATVLTQGADQQPITAGLYSLNGQWVAAWHLVSAGSIVAALPPVLMFFLMQRHFIAGLTLGAVKMIQSWRLDDSRQTLVLASRKDHLAEVVYWGPRLPDDEDLETLARAHAIDVTGGMLDANPELSLCPEATRSFPGQPGLVIRDASGQPFLPKFCFDSAEEDDTRLTLSFRDQSGVLRYRALFSIDPQTHVIEARAEIEATAPMHLHWLSAPVFPAPQASDEMIDFAGRWCGEFQMNRTAWSAGIRYRENRTGRTGHEHFPGLIVPCRGATNATGHAYGFHYGWSGGHRMIAEELPDGRRQVQFGHASRIETEAATRFATAPLYAMFSDDGLNGCAVAFQRHLRDRIVTFPDPARARPVHYNCWEAVYFDHNLPELKEIADRAADLGAERFVLDDGWFGDRDDDTTSLSDWEVDPRKYPEGLTPLIDHVHGLGMSFGIWFEPEMINEDSNVFRAHPDWALGGEDQILGRQQMALNMALPEVRDFLFDRIGKVLGDNDIDYIKWDHNRVLPMPDAAQTRGSYALIDQLRAAFPKVEIESCASGGGRIDFGILKRTHRVWLSDSNDAIERLRMQHNAALFLPMVVTGSHVGPRTCHTSGRTIDIRMRAWVAAQRHMGFEMDPRELTEDEVKVLTEVTAWWKDNRHWMAGADILRLDSSDPAVIAEQQLEQGGGQFVVFAGKAETSAQIAPRPLRLTRLSPDRHYRIELLNRGDAPALSRGDQAIKSEPLTLSGAYLMSHGLTLPWSFPETMWVVKGTLV